jgi:hypothetical protein
LEVVPIQEIVPDPRRTPKTNQLAMVIFPGMPLRFLHTVSH